MQYMAFDTKLMCTKAKGSILKFYIRNRTYQ